jgi:O-antigen/teichoic acid export membrane protein
MERGNDSQRSAQWIKVAETWRAFLVPKGKSVAEFLAWQGITMAGNLLYGLLCIRLLPIGEYAKYVVVFAIQGSLIVLMDLGISGSLISLIGERIDDSQLIADYVASLRQLAYWLFAIAAPITVLAFPFLVRHRNWSWQVVAAMVVIVLFSAWFARVSAAYGAVLIVRRDRRYWYRAQMVYSLGTLALLGVFAAFHWLSAFAAILINVAGITWVALTYFRRAGQLLGTKGVASKEKRTAVIQLTLPSALSVICYSLQGQLPVMLITIFGRTAAVASVGALSRLGQLFALLSQMNPMLVEPYFAKLPKERLKTHYFGAVAAATGFGLVVVALARIFPEAFLWILGPKYAQLRFEVSLVMIAGSMGLVGGIMATINGARRFVYFSPILWGNIFLILMQAAFIWKFDMSTVKAVLWFNIVSGLPSLAVVIYTALYGFARGGRRIVGIDYRVESD